MKKYTAFGVAIRIWILTSLAGGLVTAFLLARDSVSPLVIIAGVIGAIVLSFPTVFVISICLGLLRSARVGMSTGLPVLVLIQFLSCAGYGVLLASIGIFESDFGISHMSFVESWLICTGMLTGCALFGNLAIRQVIIHFFLFHSQPASPANLNLLTLKTNIKMEHATQTVPAASSTGNRILYKGLITGGLILLMMIPTLFIVNLIEEREARQKEAVKEVSSKWATAQTLSGPFLTVPYQTFFTDADGRKMKSSKTLVVLANNLLVNGDATTEERRRTIYEVLLYRTVVNFNGSFNIQLPANLDVNALDFTNAKLCFALSDFKGIEEEVYATYNGQRLLLSPGLPEQKIGRQGLSTPVTLSAEMLGKQIPFAMNLKIKGSEQLHFIPLAGSSQFTMTSSWESPSFDGSVLPGNWKFTDSGFAAQWNFNRANLPFNLVDFASEVNVADVAFGVSFVQPADQYDKTMRSVKYAILFVGLTFALFFIIELMQKKPFHPVQYMLVGLALVIFYTLLLSFSEYIKFDLSYLIAALATILLISLYAKSHFESWATAGAFFGMLSTLYAFIFVLIRLEDTALLVGSIGLFVVLALVMYASRKINWYGSNSKPPVIDPSTAIA